ncbi:MAG: VanZ family protein [Tenacibaculum sp.]|nr:VanZ family protein [Tenacibaculum sp.]
MLKAIKNLYSRNSLVIAIIITLSITVLSLVKLGKVSFGYRITNIDKVYHTIAYCFLALAWLIALAKNKRMIILVVICSIIFGIIIEVLQGLLTSYRTAEWSDFLANTVGVFLGLLVFKLFSKN